MPIAAFIVPRVQVTANLWRAKYQSGDPSIVRAGQLRFGSAEDAILLIEASQAYLDTIAADPECALVATEGNINDSLTAPQVSNIQAFLEARGVPADWLTAGETRRLALRGAAGMFLFSQRMEGRYGTSWKQKLVEHGVTLSSEWQSLPAAFQTEMLDTAASFNWQVSTPQPTTTLRAILRAMGNLFQGQRIVIAGFDL